MPIHIPPSTKFELDSDLSISRFLQSHGYTTPWPLPHKLINPIMCRISSAIAQDVWCTSPARGQSMLE